MSLEESYARGLQAYKASAPQADKMEEVNHSAFFRKVKFKIGKIGNMQQLEDLEKPVEETVVALEPKPKLEAVTTQDEWEELRKQQDEWRKTLEQGAALDYPRMVKFQQDGQIRYFYALKDLGRQEGEQTLTFTLRCLRDDMAVYDVKTLVQLTPFGPTSVKHEFQEVDHDKAELDPKMLYQLVKEILSGSTPL